MTASEQALRESPPTIDGFPWRTQHELRFQDMDRLGHVNNGAFASLMESNRAALLFDPGLGFPAQAGFSLARFEIDYFRELRWPGRVEAASGVEQIGTTSIRLRHALFGAGACVAAARAVIVVIDLGTRRPMPIPEAGREGLQRWRIG